MQVESKSATRRGAWLLVLVFLVADVSGLALADRDASPVATTHAPPILVDGLPPLMCGEELCERPTRMIDIGARHTEEPFQWWLSYGPDLDWNGMDDRLQRVLAGAESDSPTAITGPDGRATVAIVVDYAWYPNADDVAGLVDVLTAHGWVGEDGGAWFQTMDSLNAVVVDKVPVSALMDIYHLEGVVVVEQQNVMVPFNGVASQAARAMPSDVYAASTYERGYYGEGVVIAVLDTGVDNEHRSLNDFDDIDDDPDSDATSYNDQKWVAGYDATSSASNPDGTTDPDDGQGHGTHVAATALGTGGAQRVHTGSGMGAYLVDIKVLTDAGGTNSQYSLNGIQWMINNVNTDWGNNESSRGIQVASMSFGSLASPLNPGDEGDNGSGAEARLVNDATTAGIACVVAMGNDGSRRVPSPASADSSIAVGAADDRNTVNRTNDVVADYSNYGPRLDDGDDDEWDELKPDVTAFGSGIMSASAATGPSLPGQPERPLADNDYENKDGTSMATPVVSGIVAVLLQADDSLEPLEIRDILRNSSEQRGSATEPGISDRWNDQWGFGLVDASCALDRVLDRVCTPLEDNGDIVIDPPPGDDDFGYDVSITSLTNGTLVLAGDQLTVQGTTDITEHNYEEVQIKIEQVLDGGTSNILMDWSNSGGSVEQWYLDITVDDDWAVLDEQYSLVMVRGVTGMGETSSIDLRVIHISQLSASIVSPPLGTALVGSVTFEGTAIGSEPDRLEYKIDNGEWMAGDTLDPDLSGEQAWSFSWDSTAVDDGNHRISVRMVNLSGDASDIVRRSYEVDNLPAAPNFAFTGNVEVLEGGVGVNNAVAGTVLQIRFEVRNIGDLDAGEVFLRVSGPGDVSPTFPSEGKLSELEQGETVRANLYWWATEAGTHEVTLAVDPNRQYDDPDTTDNTYSFTFTVDERPVEPMLRFLPGAARADPSIPQPGAPFNIVLRLDNLGQSPASNLNIGLERWVEGIGWYRIDDKTVTSIQGSQTSSGYQFIRFADVSNETGAVSYRAVLSGSGVELAHSEARFNVTVAEYQVGSNINVPLGSSETVVDWVGVDGGGLLFTTRDGSLYARTVSNQLAVLGETIVEEGWGGELATLQRDDGLVHMAWTRRALSPEGYYLTDIAMASITASGKTTPKHYHMTPLKLSEGAYFGFAMDEHDGTVVLTGYHRDKATGGSWQDITSIFVLSSSTPDRGSSWGNALTVLSDIDIRSDDAQPLAVAFGEEHLHVLYQEYRSDVTGIERVGLMYTHGSFAEASWSFQSSVGDDASNPVLSVNVVDGEDRLFAAWIEGAGKTAVVQTVNTNAVWSADSPNGLASPGVERLAVMSTEDGTYLFHDEMTPNGPVTRLGMVMDHDGMAINGMSNFVAPERLIKAALLDQDVVVLTLSATGTEALTKLAAIDSDGDDTGAEGWLDSIIRYLPVSSQDQAVTLLGFSGVGLFMFLVLVSVLVRRSRRDEEALLSSMEQGDGDGVELMIQPEVDQGPLLTVEDEGEEALVIHATVDEESDEEISLAETLEQKVEEGEGNARLERRMRRKQQREMKEHLDAAMGHLPVPTGPAGGAALPLPVLPLPVDLPPPGQLPLPTPGGIAPLPELKRQATCPQCKATFGVKDLMLRRLPCPVCSTEIVL